ncbi:hypothetical protein F4677DRAFT_464447 [Hypoxylon crocopeplum]|nr:hypothetical protein F4677DRAFT_464447 [Hypoxylon crocopeplum]
MSEDSTLELCGFVMCETSENTQDVRFHSCFICRFSADESASVVPPYHHDVLTEAINLRVGETRSAQACPYCRRTLICFGCGRQLPRENFLLNGTFTLSPRSDQVICNNCRLMDQLQDILPVAIRMLSTLRLAYPEELRTSRFFGSPRIDSSWRDFYHRRFLCAVKREELRRDAIILRTWAYDSADLLEQEWVPFVMQRTPSDNQIRLGQPIESAPYYLRRYLTPLFPPERDPNAYDMRVTPTDMVIDPEWIEPKLDERQVEVLSAVLEIFLGATDWGGVRWSERRFE